MPKKIADGKISKTLEEMSQEIDLKKYLGKKPSQKEKQLFAEMAIGVINERTLDGKTINGGKFKQYSKKYADEKGVSRDSVDLFLKGDMLESIGRRTSKEKSSTIFIQMKKGLQTKKAFNHDQGDTLPKREFFGVTDSEARQIANSIKTPGEEKPITLSELQKALRLLGLAQDE